MTASTQRLNIKQEWQQVATGNATLIGCNTSASYHVHVGADMPTDKSAFVTDKLSHPTEYNFNTPVWVKLNVNNQIDEADLIVVGEAVKVAEVTDNTPIIVNPPNDITPPPVKLTDNYHPNLYGALSNDELTLVSSPFSQVYPNYEYIGQIDVTNFKEISYWFDMNDYAFELELLFTDAINGTIRDSTKAFIFRHCQGTKLEADINSPESFNKINSNYISAKPFAPEKATITLLNNQLLVTTDYMKESGISPIVYTIGDFISSATHVLLQYESHNSNSLKLTVNY